MPVSQSTSRGHIANEQSPINTSSGGSSHQAAVGCGRDRQVTAKSRHSPANFMSCSRLCRTFPYI